MATLSFIALILLCCSGCVWRSGQGGLEDSPPTADRVISADDILSKSAHLGVPVDVPQDLVYGGPHKLNAIPLTALLNAIGFNRAISTEQGEVVVICNDGYKAFLPAPIALDGSGFLAFSEGVSGAQTNLLPVRAHSGLVNLGPLYLVWTNTGAVSDRPWPYSIERIEVYSGGETLALAAPSRSTLARKGFGLFQKNCVTCHSVNGAGGRVAVDLNVPVNVTEYWREPILRRLIHDPSSVRANAKMPAFPHLEDPDLDAIIAYLHDMRSRKVMTH